MIDLPLWAQLALLVLFLLISGFFSIAETSLMAINRYRLQTLAEKGLRSALLIKKLLSRTDQLLATLLLGNNLLNTASTAMVTSLAISLYGNNEVALSIATAIIAMLIIIFAEITPKVIGAAHPEKIALKSSYFLTAIVFLFKPAVWFTNLFVNVLVKRISKNPSTAGDGNNFDLQELRSLVLESGHFLPHKPKSILLNLFELENLTVDDMMMPRIRIEHLDLQHDEDLLRQQIATAHHNKLPVLDGDWRQVKGILHVRHSIALFHGHREFIQEDLLDILQTPYFIPSGTAAIQQLQYFQENRERLGLVVDEYGEVLGLVTPEDILEELIGEFTSHAPHLEGNDSDKSTEGSNNVVDGTITLRQLNRRFGIHLPITGPKTLNGFVLELLQEIPDNPVCLRIGDVVIEIVQTANRNIKTARIERLPD